MSNDASAVQAGRDEIAEAIYRYTEQTVVELQAIAQLLQSETQDIAIGGDTDRVIDGLPVDGQSRIVLDANRVAGSDSFALTAAAAAVLLVPSNLGRLGGRVANVGATNPALLYLAAAEDVARSTVGVACVALPVGASWDFKLGDALWAGPVSALSASGTTLAYAVV